MVALYAPFSGAAVSSMTVPLVLSTPVLASVRLPPSKVMSLIRAPLAGVAVGVAVGPMGVFVGVFVGVAVGVAVAPPLPEGPGMAALSSRMSSTVALTVLLLVAPIRTSLAWP